MIVKNSDVTDNTSNMTCAKIDYIVHVNIKQYYACKYLTILCM